MHLKGGFGLIFFNRIDVDIYGGIGVARRNIEYSNVSNPEISEYLMWQEWVPQNHLFEESSTMYHLSLGFKIGVILWKDYAGCKFFTPPLLHHSMNKDLTGIPENLNLRIYFWGQNLR